MSEELTLGAVAEGAARRFGSKPFLVPWSSTTRNLPPVSFEAFAVRVRAARAARRNPRLRRGSRVAVLCHACPDSLALSVAVAECGGVVVNLNWRQPPATLRALAAGLRCSLVVAGRGLAPMARTIAAACAASALLLVEGAEAELAPLEPGELAFSCASLAPPTPRLDRRSPTTWRW